MRELLLIVALGSCSLQAMAAENVVTQGASLAVSMDDAKDAQERLADDNVLRALWNRVLPKFQSLSTKVFGSSLKEQAMRNKMFGAALLNAAAADSTDGRMDFEKSLQSPVVWAVLGDGPAIQHMVWADILLHRDAAKNCSSIQAKEALYKMVRGEAEKLVAVYRDFKRATRSLRMQEERLKTISEESTQRDSGELRDKMRIAQAQVNQSRGDIARCRNVINEMTGGVSEDLDNGGIDRGSNADD